MCSSRVTGQSMERALCGQEDGGIRHVPASEQGSRRYNQERQPTILDNSPFVSCQGSRRIHADLALTKNAELALKNIHP